MTRAQWVKEYFKMYGPGPAGTNSLVAAAPTWIIELAVRYGRLKASNGMKLPTEFKMYELCKRLDVMGVKAISDVWTFMVVNEVAEARAAKRALPKEVPNVTKSKRPTAAAAVLALLRERPVRDDVQIIAAVHAATFHDGFNQAQLAWYKAQFKQGKLKGQLGPEVIHTQDVKDIAHSIEKQIRAIV